MRSDPKLSFVVIVLNGMPFLEYAIKAIYPFAHEIIVVEGAVQNCLFAANPDGSSTDGSVECVRNFPDAEGKIRLIQGIWEEKVHMQNRALDFVTGDYVWLVDSDEIYKQADIARVLGILREDPGITQVNFIGDNFWKGFDYLFVSPKFFEAPAHFRRVFQYVKGARFTSHRPPTLMWPGEKRSTERMNLLDGFTTREMGIWPCHYSYVLENQVRQKIELYKRYGWGKNWQLNMDAWVEDFFMKWTPQNRQELEKQFPVWTGDTNSYTIPFEGTHPEVIQGIMEKTMVTRE